MSVEYSGSSSVLDRALTGLSKLTSRSKSVKELSGLNQSFKDYPTDPGAYQILDDCGRGVSATVHRALCRPLNEIIAIKKMNLESMNCDLDEIIHEAQTMRQYNHPNVLPLYCSFVAGQDLWMVMPFVAGGSVLHIMKYSHPDGLDEVVIATIMRDVLKALDYVHKQGSIHRDVKAGNILVDKDGAVKLADFGVAATLERGGSWGHEKNSRMTFVGTPCWMAPEVMEQTQGYDTSADIWSFGITLLEMAHGCAPFAKFPPMKVLLMTLQNPPPTLDDKGKKHFSKNMRDLVTRCLQKEPEKRPTTTQLLEHKFFKQARDDEYLARNLMTNLPTLAERVVLIRQGKAATKADSNDINLARSQEEYKKGVSSWNFDIVALKAAAASEPDEDASVHATVAALLPTITESEEHDLASNSVSLLPFHVGTFSGEGTPVRSSTPPISDPNSSAFASMPNQLANGSAISSQAVSVNSSRRPSLLTSDLGSGPVHLAPDAGSHDYGNALGALYEAKGVLMPASGAEAPLSPTNTGTAASPAAVSRESSMLSIPQLSVSTTPTAVTKQKKGRFNVYEHGEVVPPMSPPQHSLSGLDTVAHRHSDGSYAPLSNLGPSHVSNHHLVNASFTSAGSSNASGPSFNAMGSASFNQGTGPSFHPVQSASFHHLGTSGLSAASLSNLGNPNASFSSSSMPGISFSAAHNRASEDGGRLLGRPELSGTLLAEGEEAVGGLCSVEPSRQRGRFKIVSEQGSDAGSRPMSKAPSLANLTDSSKSRSDGGGTLVGKPPPAPNALTSLSISAVLPKLTELLEHGAAHQAALQKLVAAVQETERGKASSLLSRSHSSRVPLFDRSDADALEELRAQMMDMRAKLLALEEENCRLRSRNHTLEAASAPAPTYASVVESGSTSLDSSSVPTASAASQHSYQTTLGFNCIDNASAPINVAPSSVSISLPSSLQQSSMVVQLSASSRQHSQSQLFSESSYTGSAEHTPSGLLSPSPDRAMTPLARTGSGEPPMLTAMGVGTGVLPTAAARAAAEADAAMVAAGWGSS